MWRSWRMAGHAGCGCFCTPRGAIADWEEESLLRLRAPTCLELPTHGALSQFGFSLLGFATPYNTVHTLLVSYSSPGSGSSSE